MMQAESLDRTVKIDWLRFQFKSEFSTRISDIFKILNLPFQRKNEPLPDAKNNDMLASNKIWHEVSDYQGSLVAINYAPSAGVEIYHKYLVDLNGRTLSQLNFLTIQALLLFAQSDCDFTGNRIDIAVDFPIFYPRLSLRAWESFVEDGLLLGFRSVRRIMNCGNRDGNTVYLGSRESEKCIRIYEKFIDGSHYDRLELELKRDTAKFVMSNLVDLELFDFPKYLEDVACGSIRFLRSRSDIEFFDKYYRRGTVTLPSPVLHLDIERSIAFIQRHSATFAMLHEFMGEEKYQEFMDNNLRSGKLRMKSRHRRLIENARFFIPIAAGIFFILLQSGAIASGITCPAQPPASQVTLGSQLVQKFPIDIAMPNAQEQAYLDNIGDGCFQINSGLNFDRICLPGMIVNALKPFVIIGLGIKFIFSD